MKLEDLRITSDPIKTSRSSVLNVIYLFSSVPSCFKPSPSSQFLLVLIHLKITMDWTSCSSSTRWTGEWTAAPATHSRTVCGFQRHQPNQMTSRSLNWSRMAPPVVTSGITGAGRFHDTAGCFKLRVCPSTHEPGLLIERESIWYISKHNKLRGTLNTC